MQVLSDFGIRLSKEECHAISSFFDPTQSGRVNLDMFSNEILSDLSDATRASTPMVPVHIELGEAGDGFSDASSIIILREKLLARIRSGRHKLLSYFRHFDKDGTGRIEMVSASIFMT
jgi:Ca2+-binding EF-hand superfamily protein